MKTSSGTVKYVGHEIRSVIMNKLELMLVTQPLL